MTPSVNQIELHPRFQQAGLRREHQDRGIVTEAWSPLAQGAVLDDPVLTEIAEAHGKTTGQVVLRWHVQLDNVVFPKSVTPSGSRRTSTSSTSTCPRTRWSGSRRWTPASARARTGHVRPAVAR